MKIQGNEIKPGMIIEFKNDHWTVLKAQHVKPGKGGAFNQVELKSITKGTKLNQRFRSSENIERSVVEEKNFKSLLKFGVNYLAISRFIWNNPRLKPKEAIKLFYKNENTR